MLLADQVFEYLESNILISDHQSGCRKNFSTQTALLNLTDNTRRGFDLRMVTILSSVTILLRRYNQCYMLQLMLQSY